MIIPYETLLGLDTETLNNVIKEYLLTQVEDGSFSEFNSQPLSGMINQCKQALKTGELVVKKIELPFVLEKMERLHKSNTESPLFFLNIFFVLFLINLTNL